VFGIQFLAMALWSRLQYQRFALTQDASTYLQAFHLLSHGDLAPQASTLSYPFLQDHFELFAWPLSILDRLGPQGVSMLWAQDLFVVLAEVAAFGWMCHVVELYPPRDASPFTTRRLLALGLVLLVANPWSYWAIAFDVHVETFAAVFVVLAALEFSRGNNRWGWIWVLLTMLCGDVPTTYVAGLGLSALVAVAVSGDRRPARFLNGILLIGASVLWLAIISLLGGNKGSGVIGLYGYLAVAAGAVVPEHLGLVGLLKGIVRHPGNLLGALWHTRLNTFAHLSPAGGFGVITSWTFGVPLVVYVENSLENQKVHFFSFEPFQNFPMVVFCAVGTIVVLAWLANRYRVPRAGGSVVLAVLMANTLAWGAIWIPAAVPNWLRVSSAQAGVLARTLSEIPPNAEVVVSSGVAGPFANRADIHTWQSASEPVPVTGNWVWFVVAPGAGIAFDGTHIWVANYGGASVTELNASNGSWVQTLSGGSYGFNAPVAVAFDGTHIWVANENGASVTELNASGGSWVQTLSGGSYGFNYPDAIAFDGTHIWVANFGGNSVTELNASNGSWVRTVTNTSCTSCGFSAPAAIAFDGTHIWVANYGVNSVTELNASDGSWVRTLSGGSYGLNEPNATAFDGTHVWVANYAGNSVTDIQAG
jgi:hypothetical protein